MSDYLKEHELSFIRCVTKDPIEQEKLIELKILLNKEEYARTHKRDKEYKKEVDRFKETMKYRHY